MSIIQTLRAIPGSWLVVLVLGMAFLGWVWWWLAKQNDIERHGG